MWDNGPISTADTAVTYAGNTLNDGQIYYFRVQTYDGTVCSAWQYGTMRLNSVPTVPSGLVPDNRLEFDGVVPDLSCDNATDAEGDILLYSYEVYDDSLMTNRLDHTENYPENVSGVTTWKITATLPPDHVYFWRVRAYDGYENGDWSKLASFTLAPDYICGDIDDNTLINIKDITFLINFLYRGGSAPNHSASADTNGDHIVNIKDITYLIKYKYQGGPAPVCS
jgi:hypothetical protein